MLFQRFGKTFIDQRVKNQSRILPDAFEHRGQLTLRADKRPEMLFGVDAFELGETGLHHAVERAAGRIRNQVQMEFGHAFRGRFEVDTCCANPRSLLQGSACAKP